MRILTSTAARCAVNLAVAAGALLPAAAAHAATAPQPVQAAQAAEARATVSDAAMAAGRARFGAAATPQQALDAYWTPERMRLARPAETMPSYLAALGAAATKAPQAAQRGTHTLSVPPARPTSNGVRALAVDPGLNFTDPTAATMGKIFYTSGGLSYVCSGTVVNTAGKDAVWTGGHCLHSGAGGQRHQNWVFVPAYDSRAIVARPYGTWPALSLWPSSGWISSSSIAEDFGVAIVGTQLGLHLVDTVGGQGLQVNAGLGLFEYSFGYPAFAPFDGGHLMRCSGTVTQEITTWTSTVKMPCDMTRGASGGGWLMNYDGQYGQLNGVNSRINSDTAPTITTSSYFGDSALTLWQRTKDL
jgi:V8-like Glu-specific endopeptidase